MKSKTKAVGGTPITPIGKDWTSFLGGGLGSGNFGNNAVAQTQGFGGAINSLLGGQIGDPSTLQGFLQGLQGNGGLGNIPNVSGNFNAPQFQGLDFSQLGQIGGNVPQIFQGQGNAGLNLNGLNLPQLNQNVGGAQLPGIQFNPAQFQNTRLQGSLGAAAGLDPNGSFSQALQQIANQNLNSQVADVRERYTGQSGTPAGFAEAALRAQLTPQLTNALSQANQQERGLNLQQLGMNQDTVNQMNQLRLQQSLAGNQQNLQNAQLGLNAQGINTGNILQNQGLQNQGLLGLNSQFLQGAGLQQQQQMGLNANLLSQLGLSNDAINQFNQANLQGGQLNQNAQSQNAQNQLAQMAQMLQQSQFGNQLNSQNAQFGANFGQNAQMQNAGNMLQNQSLMNQFGLGQANVGLQNQQQQLQAILGALGPLFSGYQQAYGAGTPQAGIAQSPSMFSQITGGLANLGGAIAPFFL